MSRMDQVAVWQRRRFLQALGAAPLCGLATASVSEPLSGTLRRSSVEVVEGLNLGFSLYGTKQLPLDQSLQACAAAGYRHVEFCLNAGFPTEPAVVDATAPEDGEAPLRILLLEDSDLDAELLMGSGGIFEVALDGKVVSAKSLAGFPGEWEVVDALTRALDGRKSGP